MLSRGGSFVFFVSKADLGKDLAQSGLGMSYSADKLGKVLPVIDHILNSVERGVAGGFNEVQIGFLDCPLFEIFAFYHYLKDKGMSSQWYKLNPIIPFLSPFDGLP
jgi:hypothetical protein